MNILKSILSELEKLKLKPLVNKKILQKFYTRLKDKKILRSQINPDHFCVFFLPYDKKHNLIYLGHHIKANDWIPPGGHIEKGERPLDAVKREMSEELNFKLTTQQIELFDITIKPIKRKDCQKHYDLWYVIYMDKTDFIFDKGEFYTAKWLTLEEAKSITKIANYNQTIQKLTNF